MIENYNDWNKWYDKIVKDFNFSKEADHRVSLILNNLIQEKGKFDIRNIHLPKQCIIFGAGPSIKKNISFIKKTFNLKDYLIIAADGATTALLEEHIIPDIIVTDLDGNIEKIKSSNKQGSILYVHAHGDNQEKIEMYVPQLDNIIPTTQSRKIGLLENYGGFTDGDRAVHIAVYALEMETIILAGMDFGDIITNYSRPEINTPLEKADSFKKLKLVYAKKLIESLKNKKSNSHIKFIDITN